MTAAMRSHFRTKKQQQKIKDGKKEKELLRSMYQKQEEYSE